MSHEYSDESVEFDVPMAIAASNGLTFRFEVFIASISSKITGAIYAFIVLIGAIFGSAYLYFFSTRFEIDSSAYSLIPSLLVILLFAAVSMAHYILSFRATRIQAQVALRRQLKAQWRVESEFEGGHFK